MRYDAESIMWSASFLIVMTCVCLCVASL